jgi:hypothetical protein
MGATFTGYRRECAMCMQRVVQLAKVATLALLVVPFCIHGADAAASDCIEAANKATVESAYKVEPGARVGSQGEQQPGAPPPGQNGQRVPTVSLGDIIAVKVSGLSDLKDKCGQSPIVLFLNGYPIKTVRPYPPSPPAASGAGASSGELRFELRVTEGTKATDGTSIPSTATNSAKSNEIWRPILGRPPLPWQDHRLVEVSVGIDDQYPLKAASGKLPVFQLNVLKNKWFYGWGVLFAIMVGAFYWCVRHTNIIRNGNPTIIAAGGSWARPSAGRVSSRATRLSRLDGTYSLSKIQGALWFFVILAAYLLIGLVTGDYLNSINSTALILLGIGAGTVIGAAVIDVSKEDAGKKATEIADTEAKLKQLDANIAAIDTQLAAGLPNAPQLQQDRLDKEDEKKLVLSNYFKLTGRSEGFLTDILSDANGVSFHRFQMAVFTVVLGFVFIRGVYDDLAMPEFNQTLMGLLGLSAGTYLGLKIPEAITPKKTS